MPFRRKKGLAYELGHSVGQTDPVALYLVRKKSELSAASSRTSKRLRRHERPTLNRIHVIPHAVLHDLKQPPI
eukprot:2978232-Pyramimonas_sp.AAC.1